MGDGHHLQSHRRALVVSVCGVGFVFRARGRLVEESAPRSPPRRPSRVDGGVAATRPDAGHPAFRSRLSVYVRRVPAFFSGAPHHLQHKRGGQLCRQRGGGTFLWRAQTRAGESTTVPDESRGQSGSL